MFVPLVLPKALIALIGPSESGWPRDQQLRFDRLQLGLIELFSVVLAVRQNGLLLGDLWPQTVNSDVGGQLLLALLGVVHILTLVLQLARRLNPTFGEHVIETRGALSARLRVRFG